MPQKIRLPLFLFSLESVTSEEAPRIFEALPTQTYIVCLCSQLHLGKLQEFSKHCPDEQTNTTVALIYKIVFLNMINRPNFKLFPTMFALQLPTLFVFDYWTIEFNPWFFHSNEILGRYLDVLFWKEDATLLFKLINVFRERHDFLMKFS